jgi:deglycase
MIGSLDGRRVAFLLTDGFEDSELTSPWQVLTEAGAAATLVSIRSGAVTGKKGHEQSVDALAGATSAADFDALVLPGGVINADHLRMDDAAVALVRGFVTEGKPIAVICHGAWILIEAGGVRGRRITSYPSLRTDLTNAGAQWVDEEVVNDAGLVSSRTPKDLPRFNAELVTLLAAR